MRVPERFANQFVEVLVPPWRPLASRALRGDPAETLFPGILDQLIQQPVLAEAAAHNRAALEAFSPEHRGNRAIVLAAVRADWRALRFASSALRDDRVLALAAVEQCSDHRAFESLPVDRLQNDKRIVLAALGKTVYAAQSIKWDPDEVFEVLNPDERDRSYSSVFNNDAIGTGHARSMPEPTVAGQGFERLRQ